MKINVFSCSREHQNGQMEILRERCVRACVCVWERERQEVSFKASFLNPLPTWEPSRQLQFLDHLLTHHHCHCSVTRVERKLNDHHTTTALSLSLLCLMSCKISFKAPLSVGFLYVCVCACVLHRWNVLWPVSLARLQGRYQYTIWTFPINNPHTQAYKYCPVRQSEAHSAYAHSWQGNIWRRQQ